jgi:hypothetical protein
MILLIIKAREKKGNEGTFGNFWINPGFEEIPTSF